MVPQDKKHPANLIASGPLVTVDMPNHSSVVSSISDAGLPMMAGQCISLDDLEKHITDFRTKYGSTYSKLQFIMQNTCNCYYECSCQPSLVLVGERDENPQEVADRIAQQEYLKDIKRKRDQKLLHELAAKLGKKIT